MNTNLAVPFFVFALVPTGAVSFLFVWLLRGIVKPRLSWARVANSLSLLSLTVVSGCALAITGERNLKVSLMCFFMPQGIWTLFDALPAVVRRSSSNPRRAVADRPAAVAGSAILPCGSDSWRGHELAAPPCCAAICNRPTAGMQADPALLPTLESAPPGIPQAWPGTLPSRRPR